MSVLQVEDLTVRLNTSRGAVRAVTGVGLRLAAGETLGLVGESGCGKSMTGLALMGLLPGNGRTEAGSSVRLDGRELLGLPERQLRSVRGNEVAMVFQDPMTSLDPTKTIGYQVAEPYRLHRGASRREAAERAAEMLALVGLPRPAERLGDYPHQLSGGLRQRVMIATALVCEPRVLIADEPTTALDVTVQAQILELLGELRARLGMAMILITHDMGVVAGHADRVQVMYAGRTVESAATATLFSGMRHPYTAGLLASIPRLGARRDVPLPTIPGMPPDLVSPPAGCAFAPRCARASATCAEAQPPLSGEPRHLFACFHPVGAELPDAGPQPDRRPRPQASAGLGARFPAALISAPEGQEIQGPEGPGGGTEGADQRRGELRDRPAAGPQPAAAEVPLAPRGPEPPPLLEVVDVVREFGAGGRGRRVHAVSGVSLTLRPGETFGLVGESGCGKSTLGRVIVGLERPDAGEVLLHGRPLSALRRRGPRRDLQMMFQDPYSSLDPRMRVGAILREPLRIQRVGSAREQLARARELLDEVGLPAQALERFPHEFSGGQRQRIGLARALTLRPRIVVADEPVSALDVSIRAQVLNLMQRLQRSHGLTYLVISHDLAVVRHLADRIGVMYLGRLVEEGTGEDIYQRPAHPYTAGLLAAIPVPDPDPAARAAGSAPAAAVRGELPSPLDPPSGCRFRTRCAFAQEVCAAERPPMRAFGDAGTHRAACHFPLRPPTGDTAPPSAPTRV
ncbi:dipeptide ABC transporter ATP-binding protein [Phaeacidiphilus oryzae]|uniref:dipeptide ABC transporter ATP-binding protein n=1 Tax=Phaeacidiphilus oryzae TaxID=348818 RepID=UPI00068C3857|nr:ABC transporter ATP-binding protein [Phaeacidiphilus oryzae]